jgi:hypothetical protein
VVKFSWGHSHVNVEIKPDVSDIFSASIIRVDVVNDRMSLIVIPVCEIDASSYWCIVL